MVIMDEATSTTQHTDHAPARPDATGYVLLSAVIDGHAGPPGPAKQEFVQSMKAGVAQLRRDLFANVGVLTARRLRAGAAGRHRGGTPAHPVGGPYDVAVLLQAPTIESASWLTADPAFLELRERIDAVAVGTHVAVVHNVRRNHCEYGAQTRRLYLLVNYPPSETPQSVPAWGWTHRRDLVTDLTFSPALRRYVRDCGGHPAQPTPTVLFGLA